MPYNKFKIAELETKLNLVVQQASWLPLNFSIFEQDAWLEHELSQAKNIFLGNEKARSEFLVAPILQTFRYKNQDKLSLFSGYELNIDKSLGLNGFCDFILSSSNNSVLLKPPIFCIVECKKTEPELDDFAQCGAELYAAKLFHEQKNIINRTVYGCATSGFLWAFLKLENNILTIDPDYVSLSFNDPYKVLAVLQYLLNLSLDLNK